MDAIEPSNYEQAGWSDLTYEYVQALRTALDAEKARADAADARMYAARKQRSEAVRVAAALTVELESASAALKTANASNRGLVRLNEATQLRAAAAEAALKTAREALMQEASRDYPQEVVDWLRSIANTLIQEPRT